MRQVIQGLEEGLQSIAEALEGGGGGGGNVPTPTLDDDGKVLKVVSQSQEDVAPEWSSIREVPIGGRNGQVLTKDSNGYGWANAPTPEPELPSIGSSDSGKLLQAWYDSEEGYGYTSWGTVASVPSSNASDAGKVLTCAGRNAYGWAPASSGGRNIDVIKISVNKSDFTQDGSNYVASVFPPTGIGSKIDKLIGITIVDTADPGYPSIITPHNNDECAISYSGGDFSITISSTIYSALGNREPSIFYLTYYTGN